MFSFGYSAFGNFADQQYFTVALRIKKKKDEIQTNQCIALTGQLKCRGKDEECQLTVTATLPPSHAGTMMYIGDNPVLIQKDLCFLAAFFFS